MTATRQDRWIVLGRIGRRHVQVIVIAPTEHQARQRARETMESPLQRRALGLKANAHLHVDSVAVHQRTGERS